MAQAPGHRLGQIIGDALELAVGPMLQDFADAHDLYLDKKGKRGTRPGRKKVTWEDGLGNTHDLDYVLERGGTDKEMGVPVAFIETAWRRYTKHSRNKAQEIQGAVLPLVTKYSEAKPFAGVVLAGVFTNGSLSQLESNGFAVLYVPYPTIIDVFADFGMDVDFDEGTPDAHLQRQIDVYDSLDSSGHRQLGSALRGAAEDQVSDFMDKLKASVLRRVIRVSIVPLYGTEQSWESVGAAIEFLKSPPPAPDGADLVRFEVNLRYDNDDRITAEFQDADDAVRFLETFL